jgi:MerR family redox-sensitive transcriptional activator SoxR
MEDWPELRIGEVARRAGVAPSSIRYYESIGLLPEPDREHGQRRYDESVLGRLAFIGVAQAAGFKLAEVAELIDGAERDDDLSASMRALSERRLPEVEAQIERAEATRKWLHVASDCDCGTPEECALFPAPGEEQVGRDTLELIRVEGKSCRRE